MVHPDEGITLDVDVTLRDAKAGASKKRWAEQVPPTCRFSVIDQE
jgi:hypothetical protein